jgi:hypothetical protein
MIQSLYNTFIYNNLKGPRNRLLVRKLVVGYYEGMKPQNQQVYYLTDLYPNLVYIYGQGNYKICQCMEDNNDSVCPYQIEVIPSTSRTDSAKHTNLVFKHRSSLTSIYVQPSSKEMDYNKHVIRLGLIKYIKSFPRLNKLIADTDNCKEEDFDGILCLFEDCMSSSTLPLNTNHFDNGCLKVPRIKSV